LAARSIQHCSSSAGVAASQYTTANQQQQPLPRGLVPCITSLTATSTMCYFTRWCQLWWKLQENFPLLWKAKNNFFLQVM